MRVPRVACCAMQVHAHGWVGTCVLSAWRFVLPPACFADGCATPTIAVLYEDTKEQRHVKTYEVSLHDKVRSSKGFRLPVVCRR